MIFFVVINHATAAVIQTNGGGRGSPINSSRPRDLGAGRRLYGYIFLLDLSSISNLLSSSSSSSAPSSLSSSHKPLRWIIQPLPLDYSISDNASIINKLNTRWQDVSSSNPNEIYPTVKLVKIGPKFKNYEGFTDLPIYILYISLGSIFCCIDHRKP